MAFILKLFIVIIIFILCFIVNNIEKENKGSTISSDGHIVPSKDDFTCENDYGHHHDYDNSENRYIVHQEPETGYVILNGKKRKITDCNKL